MNSRMLGKTGREVSELGFGCGGVGGLMVNGSWSDMVSVVAHALEAGITYFDTAQLYGDGQSETNLGRVLKELKSSLPSALTVGTKVRLSADVLTRAEEDPTAISKAVISAADVSLRRLQTDCLDLFQLHNPLAERSLPERGWMSVDYLPQAATAFAQLETEGKICHWGINALGTTASIHRALEISTPATIQVCYNLLNPSAGEKMDAPFPFQDYDQLLDRAAAQNIGVITIRVLAAGALSGVLTRHAVAAQDVAPIASGADLAADVALAQRFGLLVEAGHADSLVEAALRFVLSRADIGTALVGLSSMAQLEQALAATAKGPLSAEALDLLPAIWSSIAPGDASSNHTTGV